MSEDLKPCPFCGGQPRIDACKTEYCSLHGEPSQKMRVYCYHDCPARPSVAAGDTIANGVIEAKAEAIAAWNTRATGWQPIETAPRDGAWLLACRFFDGGSFVTRVVHWSDDFDEWMVSHDGFFTAPTHWMPLPEAPQ